MFLYSPNAPYVLVTTSARSPEDYNTSMYSYIYMTHAMHFIVIPAPHSATGSENYNTSIYSYVYTHMLCILL